MDDKLRSATRKSTRRNGSPHLEEAEKRKIEAIAVKEKISSLKKSAASAGEIVKTRESLSNVERREREFQAIADAIDAAVYDLKAVNLHVRTQQTSVHPNR